MNGRVDRVLSVVLTGAAVVMALAIAKRELFTSSASQSAARSLAPEYEPAWRSARDNGIQLSGADAPIQLIEFVDLECPFCRDYQRAVIEPLNQLEQRGLGIVFIHLPLSIHRFSRVAAEAAECAFDQGRFAEFVSAILAKQDSIGLIPWASLGRSARIPNLPHFEKCTAARTSRARVDSGVAIAGRFGITGTPTVLLNGWKYARPPSLERLRSDISALKAGRPLGRR